VGTGKRAKSIAGRRILIVEDDAFVADSLKQYLEADEAIVLGPVASVAAAVAFVAACERLDGAALDVNLQGTPAFPVAEALSGRGVPFVFMTGYGADSIPARFASVPTCQKPFQPADLVALLAR
jgi:CheY-like chemotaxis protein